MNSLNVSSPGYLPAVSNLQWGMVSFGDIDGDGNDVFTGRS